MAARWTDFEDEALRLTVSVVGDDDWRAVSERFNRATADLTSEPRSPSACNHRWRDVLAPGTSRPRAPARRPEAVAEPMLEQAAPVETMAPAPPPVAPEPPAPAQLQLLGVPVAVERSADRGHRGAALSALAEMLTDKATPPEIRLEAARLLLTKGA